MDVNGRSAHTNPTGEEEKRNARRFGFTGFIFFLAVSALAFARGHSQAGAAFASLGAALIILALVSLSALVRVFRVWMAVVGVIGWVNRQVLLTIVFFLVFTPVSLALRLMGTDYMGRRFDPGAGTYWVPREDKPMDRERYEKRF
ncbi:MAG: SxtJ family membrane protein [bacterium]